MAAANVLDCPFCGTKAKVYHDGVKSYDNDNFWLSWYVKCPICGITKGGYRSQYFFNPETEQIELARVDRDGKALAIARWNERALPQDTSELQEIRRQNTKLHNFMACMFVLLMGSAAVVSVWGVVMIWMGLL